MFYFMLLRNIHLWIKTGTTPTQKGQETDYPFRKSSILCCTGIKFLEPIVIQFWAMKKTNNKNLCCSEILKYFCAAQKSPLLFRAAHRNKQKYFAAFSLRWDDTKRSNCPGRAGFAKARYMKSFPMYLASFSPPFAISLVQSTISSNANGLFGLDPKKIIIGILRIVGHHQTMQCQRL